MLVDNANQLGAYGLVRRKLPGWEQFNFEWTTQMRIAAEKAAKLDGVRSLSQFVRNAVREKIRKSKEDAKKELEEG